MAQKILGVDLGTYSIKVAEIERGYKTFELVNFYERLVSYSEALSPEESISASFQKMIEDFDLSADSVISCLPGFMTASRVITLPFTNFKKIDQTIEFEIENYVPFPLEDLLIDYHITESGKEESRILISYVKKSDFVKYISQFGGTELDPRFVGSEAVELGNVMRLGMTPPEGAYALVDIGHAKTNVTIFLGSRLVYARTIIVGGRHLTEEIAKELKVPLEEAEKIKVDIGQIGSEEGLDPMAQRVSGAIKKVLEDLLLEMKQTFLAFQDLEDQSVQALFLCGGTSRLPGIDQYLSYRLRRNVSHLDCLQFSFNRLSDSTWCRSIIPVSLGLALRGVSHSGLPDIQFRRGEFAFKGDIAELGGVFKQGAMLVGGLVLFIMITFGINYFTLKKRVSSFNKQISTLAKEVLPDTPDSLLKSPSSVLSILNGKIIEASDRTRKLEEQVNISGLMILKEVSAAFPPREAIKLDVDNLDVVETRIRISGRTDSFEAVDRIKESLNKSPKFKNVSTGNVRKGVQDEIKFDLTMDFNYGEEPLGS